MISLAQIRVLPAYLGHAVGELRIDKCSDERDCASRDPCGQKQRRRMNDLGDDVRIDKNSRAYDPAHHDHRGVK